MEGKMSFSTDNQTAVSGESETISLIAASKVKGTIVYNADGQNLGSIYDVMIDKRSGMVAYAVLSFGGFLGLGENYHPLPWKQLAYSEQYGGYLVNLSRDFLRGAPAYAVSDAPDWASPRYLGEIDHYYDSRALPL
jgi:sporulation protein YlmC with PRC-barrel domain